MKIACNIAAVLGLAAMAITSTPLQAETATKAEATVKALKVGDDAPEFKVTSWLKGDAVTIDKDKTYIIECWATWCGPCIAAFPHLSEVAKANKDKITVIGVNVWEKKTADEVKKFVADQGDKMSYLVAADGDDVIATDWLKAAGRNGIPCAFIVSKGKINWIGHPMSMKQEMLDSIVEGKYDIAAFAKEQEKAEAPGKYFMTNVAPLIQKKDMQGAIDKLEEMKKTFPDEAVQIDKHIERLQGQLKK